MATDVERATVGTGSEMLTTVTGAVQERVVGQDQAVEGLLVALLMGGHVLLEGLPGLAKMLMVRTLALAQLPDEGSLSRADAIEILEATGLDGSVILGKLLALESRARWVKQLRRVGPKR